MDQLTVGSYTITAVSDGTSRLPPMFFPGLDACRPDANLAEDGTVHIPTGCFLIQASDTTILVDAGLGPLSLPYPEGMPTATGDPTPSLADGGDLPARLRELGCHPSDVDTVLLTHLHGDHIGWVAPHGVRYFENATVMFGAADWDALIEPASDEEPGVLGMRAARDTGCLQTLDAATVRLRPGITLEHCPGHTPGSYAVVISSPTERVYLLGDIVQHPLQLNDESISFLTDTDVAQANRVRADMLRRIESEGAAAGMDHFPTATFQRISSDGPTQPRVWHAAN